MTSEEAIVWLESVKVSEAATAGQLWQMDLCDTAIGLEKWVQALRMAIKRLQPIRTEYEIRRIQGLREGSAQSLLPQRLKASTHPAGFLLPGI